MATLKVEVEVAKESYELGHAVVGLVNATKLALDDGWQAGQDLPAIGLAAYEHMVEGMKGAGGIPAESKEDMHAFLAAWNLAGLEIAGLWLKKDVQ